MSTLHSWLSELLPERSDANAHVLLKIVELLSRLNDSSWALLSSSGLLDSIKTASEHRNKEVAQQAAAIRKVRGATVCCGGWVGEVQLVLCNVQGVLLLEQALVVHLLGRRPMPKYLCIHRKSNKAAR
jgi:hypothetical protein